jgi:hypothetical protein
MSTTSPPPLLSDSPSRITHSNSYSSLSEAEGLSDSDWLDISSNGHGSDDDASDSERSFHVPSRRSSISLSSSVGDDREAAAGWEGLADEVLDEDAIDNDQHPLTMGGVDTGTFQNQMTQPISLDELPSIDPEPVSDDERVREALDQSMISTLSASRSSSTGRTPTRGSLRDLRLSFPDPLSNSREDFKVAKRARTQLQSLNSSYEDVSPTEVKPPPTGPSAEVEDPGLPSMPAVHDDTDKQLCDCSFKPRANFEIYHYGPDTAENQTFVDELVSKAAAGGWGDRVLRTVKSGALTRIIHVSSPWVGNRCITIHNVTDQARDGAPTPKSDEPSLAIIFLPYHLVDHISKHTLYLPVVPPTDAKGPLRVGNVTCFSTAAWCRLAIPHGRILRLGPSSSSLSVFKSADLASLDPAIAKQAFDSVVDAHNVKSKAIKSHPSHQSSVAAPVATLSGFLTLMIGFAIYAAFKPGSFSPPAASKTLPLTTIAASVVQVSANHSSAISVRMSSHVATVPSALKDFALAVFHPTSSEVATFASSSSVTVEHLVTPNCKPLRWQREPTHSKEVMASPSPAVSSPPAPSQVLQVINSLDARLPGSLTRVISDSVEEVRDEVQELVDVLDNFMNKLQRHTVILSEQSRERARLTGQRIVEKVITRNDRARRRAKDIKHVGGQIAAQASEVFKEKVYTARSKAVALKQQMGVEAWKAYSGLYHGLTFDSVDKENMPFYEDPARRAPRLKDKKRRLFAA